MRILLKVFVSMAVIFSLVNSSSAQFFMLENPLEGKQALDFTLDTTKAKTVNFKKYRDGQKAIIFFWATWCPHCREQLKQLNTIKQDLINKKIKLVVIDVGESQKTVTKHLMKQHMDFEAFLDVDSEVSQQYNLVGVPTLIFINKDGKIQLIAHSLPENYEEILSK